MARRRRNLYEIRYDGRPSTLIRLVAQMEKRGFDFIGANKPGPLAKPRALFKRRNA